MICLEGVARDDHSESGTGLNVGPNAVKAVKAIDPELAGPSPPRASSGTIGGYRSPTAPCCSTCRWRRSPTDRAGASAGRSSIGCCARQRDDCVRYACEITDIGRDAADPAQDLDRMDRGWQDAAPRRYRSPDRRRRTLFGGAAGNLRRARGAPDRRRDLPPAGAGFQRRSDRRLRTMVQRAEPATRRSRCRPGISISPAHFRFHRTRRLRRARERPTHCARLCAA